MNFKTTSILFVLLVAVGTYIFLTRDKASDTATTETTAAKKLLSLSSGDVQTLTLTPADGKAVSFVREGMDWKITAPIVGPAESTTVQTLVSDLTALESLGSVDVSEGTGLKQPRYVIDLASKDGKTVTLNIGDKSGVGDRLYLQVKGNAKADVVAAGVQDELDKSLNDFRQKKLVTLGTPEIKYIAINRPAGKLELVKTGESWKVTSPEAMSADPAAVTDLLAAVTGLQAVEFVDGATTQPSYGLGDDAKTVTLGTAAPSTQPTSQPAAQPAPVTIVFGKPDTILQKSVYATVSGSNVIVTVSKDAVAFLDKKPLEFRDKLIVDVEPKSVSKLQVIVSHPATTQPTTKPAETTIAAVTRRPPPASPATLPSTQASSQPAPPSTQPAPSVWIATVTAPGNDSLAGDPVAANDSAVEAILSAMHPLRTEKYVDAASAAGTTITLTLTTGGGGVFVQGKTELQIIDPGPGKPPIATYNGLHFEFDRALLEKLEADFNKPAKPEAAKPAEPPAEMGPQMMP